MPNITNTIPGQNLYYSIGAKKVNLNTFFLSGEVFVFEKFLLVSSWFSIRWMPSYYSKKYVKKQNKKKQSATGKTLKISSLQANNSENEPATGKQNWISACHMRNILKISLPQAENLEYQHATSEKFWKSACWLSQVKNL